MLWEFNRFLPEKPCQTGTLAKTLLFRLIDVELHNHLRHPTSGTIRSSRRQFRRLSLDTRQRPPRERLRSDGPLRVLPGSHVKGILSDDDIQLLAAQIAPVECLVPEGGVLAMRPLLVHASSKSSSEDSRRVLHIEYAASMILEEGLQLTIT